MTGAQTTAAPWPSHWKEAVLAAPYAGDTDADASAVLDALSKVGALTPKTALTDSQLTAAICCGMIECPLTEVAAQKGFDLDCKSGHFDCRVKAVKSLISGVGKTPPG